MERRQINANELQALFALIGEGIWYLQNVEDALNTYITIRRDIKAPGSVTKQEGEAILDKHRKNNTLGRSLKISRNNEILSQALQERAEHFRDERNWLIHRSVFQHREDLYLDTTRNALMIRIKTFSEEAQMLHKLIAAELEEFVVSKGVSRSNVTEHANNTLRRLRGD